MHQSTADADGEDNSKKAFGDCQEWEQERKALSGFQTFREVFLFLDRSQQAL